MNIFFACEYSGTFRDAFSNFGHNCMSCDLLPTLTPGNHYQGNVLDILNNGFDMMIAFPPCTYLSYAGMKYWNDPSRIEERLKALQFFYKLYSASIKHICIENPQGLPSIAIRKPDQIIHPYYFGESIQKRTCLWLKNLPKLTHLKQTDLFNTATHVPKPEPVYISSSGNKLNYIESLYVSDKTKNIRSIGFQSIAYAMAEQFTHYLSNFSD